MNEPKVSRPFFNTTVLFYPNKNPKLRLFALWYFTTLMIIWNILGHTVLGFEQSSAAPVVGVITALTAQFLLGFVDARTNGRSPRFLGSWSNFFNFLPPAIIPGCATGMLLYPNERFLPIIFAATLASASKVVIRAPVGGGHTQHIFNPSNFGIAMTLILFPDVGFAPPYHFTENLVGTWQWIVPGFILLTGLVIHGFFTGRLFLVSSWMIGFALQAAFRAWVSGDPWYVPMMPMTSAAFIIFTLYMIPDPATTPLHPLRQVAFGLAVAFAYGTLEMFHLVFNLFFALVSVCAIRGISLYFWSWYNRGRTPVSETAPQAGAGLPVPNA